MSKNVGELRINGAGVRVDADPERSLLSVLRDDLDLTGAKYGCGEGQCGACTVLVDGEPVRSCLAKVRDVGSKAITTIEGLAANGNLHPLQQAFLEADALQCGYCTGGMILAGVALLRQNAHPTRDEVSHALDGHICRCGTYPRILSAVAKAAGMAKEAAR
jgi:aerobic-type carbon monoxide dehydrogenase small subunit (CoxS/CutS family)